METIENQITPPQSKSKKGLTILIVVVIFLLAGGASAYYFREDIKTLLLIKDFFPEEEVEIALQEETNNEINLNTDLNTNTIVDQNSSVYILASKEDTTNWEIYEDANLSFRYPKDRVYVKTLSPEEPQLYLSNEPLPWANVNIIPDTLEGTLNTMSQFSFDNQKIESKNMIINGVNRGKIVFCTNIDTNTPCNTGSIFASTANKTVIITGGLPEADLFISILTTVTIK